MFAGGWHVVRAASQERVPHPLPVLRNMLAPRMSSVNVKGLRETEESYSVLFTPVATLPISMKISSGNYTKCVPWSEIPGPNYSQVRFLSLVFPNQFFKLGSRFVLKVELFCDVPALLPFLYPDFQVHVVLRRGSFTVLVTYQVSQAMSLQGQSSIYPSPWEDSALPGRFSARFAARPGS